LFEGLCLDLFRTSSGKRHQEPQQTNKEKNPEEAAYYRKTNLEPTISNPFSDKIFSINFITTQFINIKYFKKR
jgi:hypothetical protein